MNLLGIFVPWNAPFYVFVIRVRRPQRLRSTFTPPPASETRLEGFHAVSSVLDTAGRLSRRLRGLRHGWKVFTSSPAFEMQLEGFHAVSSVLDTAGRLSRRIQRLRRGWKALMPSPATKSRLEGFHTVSRVLDAYGSFNAVSSI
jgi:hypothetical protein